MRTKLSLAVVLMVVASFLFSAGMNKRNVKVVPSATPQPLPVCKFVRIEVRPRGG